MFKIDLTGKKFTRWTVLEYAGKKKDKQFWLCRCDCGNEKHIEGHTLRIGTSKSCGCLQQELLTTHGHTTNAVGRCTKTYNTWRCMIKRCYYPKHQSYKNYGERGITVCKRWRDSFENFLEDMGERPEGMNLDRINNSKGYCKSNCRWANAKTQNRNKRGTLPITQNGVTKVATEWCEELGLNKSGFFYRYHHPSYDAFTPVRKRRAA